MGNPRNQWLMVGAPLSAVAAMLHVGIILGGPGWYRFFGAGERFAQLDAAGSHVPDLVTLGIAVLLGLWAMYALSGAGAIRRLPLLRTALVAITAVYLARGLVLFPLVVAGDFAPTAFDVWSSLVCLGYGLVHLVGLACAWRHLAPATATVAPVAMEEAR